MCGAKGQNARSFLMRKAGRQEGTRELILLFSFLYSCIPAFLIELHQLVTHQ